MNTGSRPQRTGSRNKRLQLPGHQRNQESSRKMVVIALRRLGKEFARRARRAAKSAEALAAADINAIAENRRHTQDALLTAISLIAPHDSAEQFLECHLGWLLGKELRPQEMRDVLLGEALQRDEKPAAPVCQEISPTQIETSSAAREQGILRVSEDSALAEASQIARSAIIAHVTDSLVKNGVAWHRAPENVYEQLLRLKLIQRIEIEEQESPARVVRAICRVLGISEDEAEECSGLASDISEALSRWCVAWDEEFERNREAENRRLYEAAKRDLDDELKNEPPEA